MFKWFSTLVFTNFILYCNSVALLNEETNEEVADRRLARINYREILPLVLFLVNTEKGPNLDVPEDIIKAEINKRGKMMTGTEFSRPNSQTQFFFCRDSTNPTKECLAPKNFMAPERLRCDDNLESTAKVGVDKNPRCGVSEAGFFYNVYYLICPSIDYITQSFGLYGFCYLHGYEKTLFTKHIITSPKLLNSKLFLREQQIDYPFEPHITGLVPANTWLIINARDSASSSRVIPQRPKYGVQRLVPKEDMALGIWKKTTNQAFNFELQQNDLIPIWDEISLKVRQFAIEHDDRKIIIITAVIDNKVGVPEGKIQIYNRWVKMVLSMSQDLKEVFGGVIFFMNNFLFLGGEFEYHSAYLEMLEQEVQEYCETNICTYEFQQRARSGSVKCCKVTLKITELLFGRYEAGDAEVLEIPGLTQLPYT